MDKKIFINYIYNILYQIVKIILPLITVSYTYSHVGASTVGINDLAVNIAGWFVLFGILGVNTYGNREIAKIRDNKEVLSRNFYEILIMQWCNMTIALLGYFLYTTFFVADYKVIYYLVCISVLSSALDISWFYYGVENFRIVSIRNTIVKIVGVCLIFLVVKTPEDLWKLTLINTSTDLIGQALTYTGLKKYLVPVKVTIKDAYKHHFMGTFALFIPTLATSIYTMLDQTLLGFMASDTAQLSYYKTASNFDKTFLYFITSIGSVVMPRIANAFNKNKDKAEVNKYINITFKLALLLSLPIMTALITVSPYFFTWYLPNDYKIMITLVSVLSPIIVLISFSNVFGIQYLVPVGKNSKYTISIVAGAVVDFIINLFVIPKYGALGACLACVAAEFTVTFTQWLFVRKDLEIHALKSTVKVVIASALMGLVVVFIGEHMSSSILTNAVQALVGAIIYVGVLIALKEQTITNILNKYLPRKNKNA